MTLKELKRKLIRAYSKRIIAKSLETENITCPLCDQNQKFKILMSKDRYGLPITTVQCSCGFVFTNPMPTEKFLNHFYSSFLFRALDWGVLSVTPGIIKQYNAPNRADNHISFIKRVLLKYNFPSPRSLLDIGTSEGTFLKTFHELYSDSQLYAVEPGNFRRSIKGIVVWGHINEIPLDIKFDMITLWHVLEHVRDPKNFLLQIAKHMDKDSKLLIEVPDFTRYKNDMRPIHIDHVVHFSPMTLEKIATEAGLKVVEIHANPSELMDKQYGIGAVLERN